MSPKSNRYCWNDKMEEWTKEKSHTWNDWIRNKKKVSGNIRIEKIDETCKELNTYVGGTKCMES